MQHAAAAARESYHQKVKANKSLARANCLHSSRSMEVVAEINEGLALQQEKTVRDVTLRRVFAVENCFDEPCDPPHVSTGKFVSCYNQYRAPYLHLATRVKRSGGEKRKERRLM